MKYNLLNELKKEYNISLEHKMSWGMSQVELIYEDVRKHIEKEASEGNRITTISLDLIKKYLPEDVSKDDGYFIVQSFIEKLEKDSYYTVSNKKRLSFDLCGWDVPWVNKDVYDDFRNAVMSGDCEYDKCRLKFLEFVYLKLKETCDKARDTFTCDLVNRDVFGDCYSDYLALDDSQIGILFNEVRSALEDSGVKVSVLTKDSIILGGWIDGGLDG